MRPPLAERVVDLEYAAAWRLVRGLPERVATSAFTFGGDLASRRRSPAVRQLRANLARAVPGATAAELDALVRTGMRSYARYWCETFRLPVIDPLHVHRETVVSGPGEEPLLAAIDAGTPVVLGLPHSGNWDAAGIWLVETLRLHGRAPGFTTVAQRLRPESLYRRFVDYREALGFEVVAMEDGSAAHRALTRRLRGTQDESGGVVCLLADRDIAGTGTPVTLFGEPTRLPTGPARLAALTGAVIVPTFPHFTATGWGVRFGAPITVPTRAGVAAATQELADALGTLIATAPADWHVLQPVWAADRVVHPVPTGAGPT